MKAKQKPRNRFLNIPVVIYRRQVVVAVGDVELKDIVAYAKKNAPDLELSDDWKEGVEYLLDDSSKYSGCLGLCTHFGEQNTDILVVVKGWPKTATEFGVLYHELYHAVEMIAADVDRVNHMMTVDDYSEPRAYLIEYLMTECNKALWQ
jgi:hypothetical protein